jgi:predicted nucleic acid-binding protein
MSIKPAYLIDTDVIIWVLRKRPRPLVMLQALAKDGPLGCSVLTVSELLRQAKEHEIPTTERLLDSLIILPIGVSEAKMAGILMRNRGPGYVDCHIAATALLGQIMLVTYNHKDYERTGVKLFDTSEWDPQVH